MKIQIAITLILFTGMLCAQNCDYDFQMGTVVYIPTNLDQTAEQKTITKKNILEQKSCLKRSKGRKERYWYSNSIANQHSILSDVDSTIKYTLLAFELDTANFCAEYVDMHVSSLDSNFPFRQHFLDVLDAKELILVRTHCKNHYLENEIKAVERKKGEKKRQLENQHLNKDYITQLNEISLRDQQERKNQYLDWEIQNRLDSINRNKLDALYESYGFPSVDKVTSEGVTNAFMILHHSTDCHWNQKWTLRFLDHYEEHDLENLFSFYFYRNYNPTDGNCKDYQDFLTHVKETLPPSKIDKLLNFSKWEKVFKDH